MVAQYKIDNNIQDSSLFVGDKKIECGLCDANVIDVLKNIQDDSVDMVYTDFSCFIIKRGGTGNSGDMCKTKGFSDGRVFEFNDVDPNKYMSQFYRILKDESYCYIMTTNLGLFKVLDVAQSTGFYFIKSFIWNKSNKVVEQSCISQIEYILFFRKNI